MNAPKFESLAQSFSSTLQNLEEKRIELKKQGHSTGIWAGGILFVIVSLFFLYVGVMWGVLIGIIIGLLAYFGCINSKSQELSAYYKKEVIAKVLQSFCEDAVFIPEEGIDKNVFKSSKLYIAPDRYHTEDLIKGHVGKTEFCCAEVHAEERKTRVNSKGRVSQYWVDIFRGFFFIADFHKDFQGQTTILRNNPIKLNFNSSRVKLENPDFEKTFDVYSTDQVEARYLLSPSMMEQLVALDRKLNKDIKISFQNSNILIAIPESINHFEANIWKPINDLNQLKSDFSTIHMLVSIVDSLNLNTRIWTKE